MSIQDNWDNNDIQFPRLIAELQMAGAFTPEVMEALQDSMDLELADIDELMTRADVLWDQIKKDFLSKEKKVIMDESKNYIYLTEDGHRKADCPECGASEHVDFLIEQDVPMCQTCVQEDEKNMRAEAEKHDGALLIPVSDEDIKKVEEQPFDEERFKAALQRAEDAFWREIADSYLEAEYGDLSVESTIMFSQDVESAAREWVRNNAHTSCSKCNNTGKITETTHTDYGEQQDGTSFSMRYCDCTAGKHVRRTHTMYNEGTPP
jgi:hypothetical protein